MKKIVMALAAIAVMAAVSSCGKSCTCTTYINGELITEVSDIDISESNEFNKCSDMNSSTTVLGITTEVKCHMD